MTQTTRSRSKEKNIKNYLYFKLKNIDRHIHCIKVLFRRSIKSKLGVVLTVILTTGCVTAATTSNYEKLVRSWVGSPEDKLIMAWGPPAKEYRLDHGGKIISYNDVNGTSGYSDEYGGFTSRLNYCRTDFTIAPNGIIVNWRFEGNTCRALPEQVPKSQRENENP